MDTTKLTSATEWRRIKEEGQTVELPSGNVVQLRPVSMEALYASGAIVDGLTPIVASIISTGGFSSGNEPEAILDAAKKMIELKRILCTACMLSPKIVDEPDYDNNEIAYFDLSSEDSEFIMSWAQRPQKNLSSFRTE